MRKLVLSCVAGMAALGTSAALADDYKGYDSYNNHWWNSDIQAFYDCAWSPSQWFDGTITDAVVATATGPDPEFTVLLQAVLAAKLEGALASDAYFTVYAPTDAAFGAVPGPLLDLLLADPEGLLADVLLYHVTTDSAKRADPRRVYRRAGEVETLNGQSVFVNRGDDSPMVNGSNAACTPVQTRNGVIYVIDSVLLPQFLQSEPEPEPAH